MMKRIARGTTVALILMAFSTATSAAKIIISFSAEPAE
jgi:hypothetical protein